MGPKILFKYSRKIINLTLIIAFVGSSLYVPKAQAGEMVMMRLSTPGAMVHLSPEFTPAHLQGLTIHPDNALQFDFLIHKGDGRLDNDQKQEEYTKLVKYFLASLTIPDEDQWVNLSPYEHNRIIKDDFGKTEMGRDLLSQDYLLKQITSSLMYPESGLGKTFWNKVYERAYKEFGTTNIPVNTFNKVWIIPDEAAVYESGNTVYILRNHLKVMLEEDYLSLEKHSAISVIARSPQGDEAIPKGTTNGTHAVASKIIKQILLPELEKEVNEGKNFAMLRQIYSGMILATWYKHALKESLLGQMYANKSKVIGVDQKDPQANEAIYQRYLKAFKKGAFNYIKEDEDKYSQELVPRKYFAGGIRDFASVVAVSDTTKGFSDETVLVFNQDAPISKTMANKIDRAEIAGDGIDRAMVRLDTGPDLSRRRFLFLGVGAVTAVVLRKPLAVLAASEGPELTPMDSTGVLLVHPMAKKIETSPGVFRIRALNGNKDAMSEIIRRSEKELPFAWVLNDLSEFRLEDAVDSVKNGNFSYYFKKAENGNFEAFDFFEPVFYVNRQVRDYIRDMDTQIFERRSEPFSEIGEGKVWENRRKIWESKRRDYVRRLCNLAFFHNNLNAMADLRNIDPTGLEHSEKVNLAEFGNSMAISQLSDHYSAYNIEGDEETPFDAEVFKDPINKDNYGEKISKMIAYVFSFQRVDENFLREYDFPGLIEWALSGNEYAYNFVHDLIIEMGHKKIAEAWRSTGLSAEMKKNLKEGDYKTFTLLMELYKFGNQNAIIELPYTDLSGLKTKAEAGDLEAIQTLIGLVDYRHPQAAAVLRSIKIDQIIKPFRVGEAKGAEEKTSGNMQAVALLIRLALDFDNPFVRPAIEGDKLDFSKAGGFGYVAWESRLESYFDIADMGNTLMGDYLKREINVQKDFTGKMLDFGRRFNYQLNLNFKNSDPNYLFSKRLYILAMKYNNPSAWFMLGGLNSEELSNGVESGEPGFSELLYAQQRKLADESKKAFDLKALDQKIFNGEENQKREKQKKEQEKKEQFEKDYQESQEGPQDQQQSTEDNGSKPDNAMKGGIDFNSANLNLQIKRDGRGVPLPLLQQDWAKLNQIQGLVPTIIEIRPVTNLPILSELQQKFQSLSAASSGT
jgi:hypothetical protein